MRVYTSCKALYRQPKILGMANSIARSREIAGLMSNEIFTATIFISDQIFRLKFTSCQKISGGVIEKAFLKVERDFILHKDYRETLHIHSTFLQRNEIKRHLISY